MNKELTYEERVRWFVNNYYETGMEYASMLESMKNEDLDNFVWYGEKIQIPKFYSGNETLYTEEDIKKAFEAGHAVGVYLADYIKEKIDKLTDELKKVYELSFSSQPSHPSQDSSAKNFFMKGFQVGYNTAKPDEISAELRYKDGTPMRKYNSPKLQAIEMEISDEEIERGIKREYLFSNSEEKRLMIEGAKWYREQLKRK
jgi:hypothetical protein